MTLSRLFTHALIVLSVFVCAGTARPDDTASSKAANALPVMAAYPPKGFVFVRDIVPDAVLDVRYYGDANFVGTRIDGYEAPQAILSVEAAVALRGAVADLRRQGYTIKVFDAYRPEWAVRHFVRWAKDLEDTRNKARFYPDVDKTDLFRLGYIAGRSGHARGSTIDLTLVDLKSGREVDMGSFFDFFGEISHHTTTRITPQQAAHRVILRDAMEANGFKRLKEEWWHYSLKNEPYPDVFFDFPVGNPEPAEASVQKMLTARVGDAARAIVVSNAPGADGNRIVLRAYVKTDGVWTLRFSTNGWIGKGGFKKDKREGDGATPIGDFSFGRAFGIADDPGALLPYTKVGAQDVWVDDPASKHYNRWMRADAPDADWKSAERLADYKKQYEYAVTVDYNVDPVVPGKGSAIFLHVATGKPTAGCVAVPRAAMVFLLNFVGRDTRIVLGPEVENR